MVTRWAIKEAIFKALHPSIIGLQEISIKKIDNVYVWINKPNFITQFKISTSTERDVVIASVIGLDNMK